MIVKTLSVGQLQTNCYVVRDETTGRGAIVDPGAQGEKILDAAAGLHIDYVINTHAHFDHVLANRDVIQGLRAVQTAAPLLVVHRDAAALLAGGGGAGLFGFAPVSSPKPDRLVSDGDVLTLGGIEMQVLHTPGHSSGSISLYCASEGVVFSGDVLFRHGVGRADLPGGDWDTLMHTITERLFALPDDTQVYPGHGPPTTVGREKKSNPFIRP